MAGEIDTVMACSDIPSFKLEAAFLTMNAAGQPGAAQLHTFPGLPGMPVGLHIPTAPIQTAMHQMPNGGTQFAFDQSMMKALYDQQKG